MKLGVEELDFTEIDIKNPFSITESTLSPKRKSSASSLNDSLPYPTDIQNDFSDPLVVSKKSNRGRKLDNFDYNSKIQEELQKMGEKIPLDMPQKKLIQKIRNRISANRSRMRLKTELDHLQEENSMLRNVISNLQERLEKTNDENKLLRQKLFQSGAISPPVTPQAEPAEYIRTDPNIGRNYVKNTFFIAAIILAVACLGTTTINRVKMGGAVPLLSFNTQKAKTKSATITDFCNNSSSSETTCGSPKKYLYKIKHRINKKITPIKDRKKTLPQYKIKDFMTEIVSFTCQSNDNNGLKFEKVFLFDKETAEEAGKTKEPLYVSETWSVEYIDN